MMASEMTKSSIPGIRFGNHVMAHAVVDVLSSLAYAGVDILLAILFYKFGPRVSRFFVGDDEGVPAPEATN